MTKDEALEHLKREADANYHLSKRYDGDLELQTQYDSAGRAFEQAYRIVQDIDGLVPTSTKDLEARRKGDRDSYGWRQDAMAEPSRTAVEPDVVVVLTESEIEAACDFIGEYRTLEGHWTSESLALVGSFCRKLQRSLEARRDA